MANEQVAERTMIVRRPDQGEGEGVVVAAGDPIPPGYGLIQNTPNKVDAATNYETADAADQAQSPTPAGPTTVAPTDPGAAERAAAAAAAAERVAANTSEHENSQRWLGEEPVDAGAAFGEDVTPPATSETPAGEFDESATVKDIDAKYGSLEGYPASANKAEKVAFVKKALAGTA